MKLSTALTPIRQIDPRMVSYNIEMTEVTGGTFWKAYTSGQIDGTEEFRFSGELTDFTSTKDLVQYYPPINLYDEKLRAYARKLGPAWIRVSGTWATKTYYDFEGKTQGVAPEGYASVLTKAQWIGVLDFVQAVGGKLLISISNCAGDHPKRRSAGPDAGKKDLCAQPRLWRGHRCGGVHERTEYVGVFWRAQGI